MTQNFIVTVPLSRSYCRGVAWRGHMHANFVQHAPIIGIYFWIGGNLDEPSSLQKPSSASSCRAPISSLESGLVDVPNVANVSPLHRTLSSLTHLSEVEIHQPDKMYCLLKVSGCFDLSLFKSLVCPPVPSAVELLGPFACLHSFDALLILFKNGVYVGSCPTVISSETHNEVSPRSECPCTCTDLPLYNQPLAALQLSL